MIVIVHQAIGMAEPAEAIDDMREERQPRGSILIGRDDVLPGVAATGDMIDGVGKFKTQGAGHGASVSDGHM